MSTPSPGGVDRACNDAGTRGGPIEKVKKTLGFSTFSAWRLQKPTVFQPFGSESFKNQRIFNGFGVRPARAQGQARPGPGQAGAGPGQARGALSGSCAQVPESASEGFSLSAPSPGGVDRAPADVRDRAVPQKKAMNTNGFSPFSGHLLSRDRCLLLRQDRCLLSRQDRCLLLRQDRRLLFRQDACLLL